MTNGRLTVQLHYETRGFSESFDWQLYGADELAGLASGCSFDLVQACSRFDENAPATGEQPRMQLVLEAV